METLTGISHIDKTLVADELEMAGVKPSVKLENIFFLRSDQPVGKFKNWLFFRRNKEWLIQTERGRGLSIKYFEYFQAKWHNCVRPVGFDSNVLFSRFTINKNLTVDRLLICQQKCLNDFVNFWEDIVMKNRNEKNDRI